MRVRAVVLWGTLAFAVACLVGGCGDSQNRQAVHGTVTFKNQPLDQGSITFVPASADIPTQSGTLIKNGNYQIPRDKGLAPGTYKVAISSGDGKTPDPSSDAPPGPSGNFSSVNRIPAEYNTESKLEVTVKNGGNNKFDFTIP